ncbi:MAG: hypothetical protein KC471_08210 [Flavobacteriaceae bacterium]|nr:hypothetical protein [Flavobacteriaceae bacterium]
MKLKNITLFLFLLILTSCAQVETNKLSSSEQTFDKENLQAENSFIEKYQSVCNMTLGYLNNFCRCLAEEVSTFTPQDLKSKVLKQESWAIKEFDTLMDKNKDRIMACYRYKSEDYKVSEIDIPDLAKDYVEKYKIELLTPENRVNIKPILPLGYQYRLERVDNKSNISDIKRLTKIEDGFYYFSTIRKNGDIYQPDFYRYKYGIESIHLTRKASRIYETDPKEYCKFTLGECAYKGVTQTKIMFTKYVNGVWISNERGYWGRNTVYRIYKKDGLLLYKHTIFPNKKDITYLRQEYY